MSYEHMSDKDMDAVLREWTQEAPAGQPDRSRVVGDVVGQLGSTRRRRRRSWPWRLLDRKPSDLSAIDKTEYQPNPIPASNGHTPTVIGRTQSMLSPVKAITAGAIVFAIGGAFLIAQPFHQQGSLPGAEVDEATTEPSAPAIVTGNMLDWGEVTQEATQTMVDGVDQRRGVVREGARFEMDDPRLTGTVSYESNLDGRKVGSTDAVLLALRWRIENEEGSWSGSCPSMQFMEPGADPSMMDPIVFSCLYTGAGAYEGLSAYLEQQFAAELPYPIKGLIFEGDLPPMPEMATAE